MQQVSRVGDEVVSFLNGFEQTLQQVSTNAQTTNRYAEAISAVLYVAINKIHHIIFKRQAYENAKQQKVVFPLPDHHNCGVGRLYYSEASERLKTQYPQQFGAMEAPHKRLHDCALATLPIVDKGMDEMLRQHRKLVDELRCMEAESETLFSLLNEMGEDMIRKLPAGVESGTDRPD